MLAAAAALLLAPAAAADSALDVAAARAVLAALEKKAYDKAKALAAELEDPLQKKALEWRLAQLREMPYRFTEIAAIHRAAKDWPALARIADRVEDVIGTGDADEAVIAWFEEHPPRGVKGWIALIESLARSGKAQQADAAARRAWTTYAMPAAEEPGFLRRYGKHIGPDEDRLRLLMLLRARRTAQALALWDKAELPAEEKAAAALRIVMQAAGRRRPLPMPGGGGKTVPTALPAEIEAQIARLPEAIRASPDFRFDHLSWTRRTGHYETAAKLLENLPDEEDDERRWRVEGTRVARELLDDGKPELAYRAATAFRNASGETWAAMEFLAGWIALRKLSKPADALPHFQRLFEKSGAAITKGRGAYWAARAAAAAGDKEGERRWLVQAAGFPHVFYGQLATAALGRDRLTLPADLVIDDGARKSVAEEEIARAAALFAALDEPALAHSLLLHLAMQADDPRRWAAVADYAANGAKRREVAVRAARRAAIRSVPLFALGFPTIELPAESKIEPAFAFAIIRQESEFYLAAISGSGARGLMQLMPATARETARRIKLRYDLAKLTADEAYNLRLGTAFLHRLVERFGGLYPLAAAAYNAGPGNLNKWLAKYGDPRTGKVDLVDWIESIPFEETRNYVHRVIENLTIYRHRAGLRSLAREPGALWRALDDDALKLPAEPPPEP